MPPPRVAFIIVGRAINLFRERPQRVLLRRSRDLGDRYDLPEQLSSSLVDRRGLREGPMRTQLRWPLPWPLRHGEDRVTRGTPQFVVSKWILYTMAAGQRTSRQGISIGASSRQLLTLRPPLPFSNTNRY